MIEYIIDFQAFKSTNNTYILKELAVISVHSTSVAHCIVKPPYSVDVLSEKKKREVKWLAEKFHGILWEDGYISQEDAIRLLKDFTKDADNLLIKGSERKKFVERVTGKQTQDLDLLECPVAKKLSDSVAYPSCFYFSHWSEKSYDKGREREVNPWNFACSLKRVYKLRTWYKTFLNPPSFQSDLGAGTSDQELQVIAKESVEPKNELSTATRGYDIPPNLDKRSKKRFSFGLLTCKDKFTFRNYN